MAVGSVLYQKDNKRKLVQEILDEMWFIESLKTKLVHKKHSFLLLQGWKECATKWSKNEYLNKDINEALEIEIQSFNSSFVRST